MPRKTYTPEFRAHLVALVRQGRTPESLSREFEPSGPTIRAWVEAADAAQAGGAPADSHERIRAAAGVLRSAWPRVVVPLAVEWQQGVGRPPDHRASGPT